MTYVSFYSTFQSTPCFTSQLAADTINSLIFPKHVHDLNYSAVYPISLYSLPRVSQVGGVVQWASASHIPLVHISSIL